LSSALLATKTRARDIQLGVHAMSGKHRVGKIMW